MKTTSIDPAKASGVVVWLDGELAQVWTLRDATAAECRKKGLGSDGVALVQRLPDGSQGAPSLSPRRDALRMLCMGAGVVVEESMGASQKTVAQLGERRGYIRALCDELGARFVAVNTSEWRRVVGEHFGVTFPRDSELSKALAVKLVRERFGWVCSHDEADAMLVGLWAWLTRTWERVQANGGV